MIRSLCNLNRFSVTKFNFNSLRPKLIGLSAMQAQVAKPVTTTTQVQSNRSGATVASAVATADEVETKEVTAPKPIYRKDYKPTPYTIDKIDLRFQLGEESTTVTAKSVFIPKHSESTSPQLKLNGRSDVKFVSAKINGNDLTSQEYSVDEKFLTIPSPPEGEFTLETVVEIKPQENSLLEGLYKSGGNFCTQCEAEGFRGITYTYDRPDVMSKYTTRIEADKSLYPVLLSNGNLIEEGDLDGGKHYAVWEDPFKKPCYLFALVAGALKMHEDSFTTTSGKVVKLRIFVAEKDLGKVEFAMTSLKKAMKWDEDVFGLEYDLDLFNIVAVDDFNMGAMENKSLNIFNSKLVLASPETATDGEFRRIEGVVAHEYFHNWTGNRVTCRDWFQLTLKEGLTVFRDSEFTSDMNSRAVKRVEDAMVLRRAQFPEDAGPMAHPIRPNSYIKMDNFYTATVYEKGCEIIRLYNTILGRPGFRKGMDLYFERHDGNAVTCDDFLAAMADANGENLTSLGQWYSQAGTPKLHVVPSYDPSTKEFTIKTKQLTPETPDQTEPKKPVLIPLKMGIIGPDGKEVELKLKGDGKSLGTDTVLRCENEEDTFVFENVPEGSVPSLLRDFSAPVVMTVEGQTDEDLTFLLKNDTDEFNRWEAAQRLAQKLLLELYEHGVKADSIGAIPSVLDAAGGVRQSLVDAFKSIVTDDDLDGEYAAMALALPSVTELVAVLIEADPLVCHHVRDYVRKSLATSLQAEFEDMFARNVKFLEGKPYSPEHTSSARRAAKNCALSYLVASGDPKYITDCYNQFQNATNMTDSRAALSILVDQETDHRQSALEAFFNAWKDDPMVLLAWFSLQSMCLLPNNLANVKALEQHPKFNAKNPNYCYSMYLGFTRGAVNFHAADGSGYEFLADVIKKVDGYNHQVAARIATTLTSWKQYDKKRQELIKAQVQRILDTPGISENVYEVMSKTLA